MLFSSFPCCKFVLQTYSFKFWHLGRSVWKRITTNCLLSHMLLCTSTPINQLLCSYLVGAAAIQNVFTYLCWTMFVTLLMPLLEMYMHRYLANFNGDESWYVHLSGSIHRRKIAAGDVFLTMVPLYIDTQIIKTVISSNVRNWQNIQFINGASIKQLKNKRFTCTKRTCSHHRYSVWLHRPNL